MKTIKIVSVALSLTLNLCVSSAKAEHHESHAYGNGEVCSKKSSSPFCIWKRKGLFVEIKHSINGEVCSMKSSSPFCKEINNLLASFQLAHNCRTSVLSQVFNDFPKNLDPQICYSGTIANYLRLLDGEYPNTALLPLYFPQGARAWSKVDQSDFINQYQTMFPVIIITTNYEPLEYEESSKAVFFVRDFCSNESFLNEITRILAKNQLLRPISNIFFDSCKSTSALSVVTIRSKL